MPAFLASTIVWWHCAWFRRRPGFILSLWLSRRIHNCYLMARKEIANKYSLHSHIPFLRTTMRTVALKISIMRQTGNSLLFKFIWLTCFQKKIWPTFLKYFIFCGGLTDCDRICVWGDNEDMCARGSCPLSTKGGEFGHCFVKGVALHTAQYYQCSTLKCIVSCNAWWFLAVHA